MIKIYFDNFFLDDKIKSENFWAFNGSEDIVYETFFKNKNNIIKKTSLEECEYIFLPYKWDGKEVEVSQSKKIIAFFNDDYEGLLDIPKENFILFRTSTNRTNIKNNERVMPAFCEKIDFVKVDEENINKRTISFCGQVDSFRSYVFSEIDKSVSLNKNFIFRKGFWASEIQDKKLAREQYFENITNSLFVLCMRGAGNFSYRLYETMAAGRIPIIINSDLRLPIENILNWKEFSIIIEKEEIRFLDFIIDEFLQDKDIVKLCKNNKKIWDEYFSPHGFIKNIKSYIDE